MHIRRRSTVEPERAVFIDKDGTLIENLPFNVDPQKIRLSKNSEEGLARLHALNFRIVVVSNQPGVAAQLFPQSALNEVRERLETLVANAGARLDGFYFCPHEADDAGRSFCTCRKPKPGLLFCAARELGLSLPRSWLIGDILDDIQAGRAAGVKTIMIDNGGETEWRLSPARVPHYRVFSLSEAALAIEQDEIEEAVQEPVAKCHAVAFTGPRAEQSLQLKAANYGGRGQ